ncbi:MAG: sulfatase-like hydrolase/transferase [Chryseolinea sp.]
MRKLLTLLLFVSSSFVLYAQKMKTENVVLITLDGMRWQEIFNGGDSAFMRQQEFLKDPKLKDKFWRNDMAERRKALLPFLWTTVAQNGQLYGNRKAGSLMNVSNNQWFSYPGYNELLTGTPDNEHIHSNDKFLNPNTNVLEFIQSQPGFAKKVAAYTSWDVFPFIINEKRNGIPVSSGLVKATGQLTEEEQTLNKLMVSLPNPLGDVRLDAFTFYYGLQYMKKNKPRVMYFSFDETDDFAHGGEYAAYLNSAHNTDGFFNELWNYLQSESMYKGKTTLIITCDHGRGPGTDDWKNHGTETPGSDQIWMAVIGPDTPATGEITSGQNYQNQIAKTLASLLGLEYKNQKPVGDVIQSVMTSKSK